MDSLLGARGGSSEHEATRKTRNEFMAAWDGICSKDNERVLVLAATNRPFDLDDAVIRRLPRRCSKLEPPFFLDARGSGGICTKHQRNLTSAVMLHNVLQCSHIALHGECMSLSGSLLLLTWEALEH